MKSLFFMLAIATSTFVFVSCVTESTGTVSTGSVSSQEPLSQSAIVKATVDAKLAQDSIEATVEASYQVALTATSEAAFKPVIDLAVNLTPSPITPIPSPTENATSSAVSFAIALATTETPTAGLKITPSPLPAASTFTPQPTYTVVPTLAARYTPQPTYTVAPTLAPTYTPYPTYIALPTYTVVPTLAPTYTPQPTYTALPTYTVVPTPIPSATSIAAISSSTPIPTVATISNSLWETSIEHDVRIQDHGDGKYALEIASYKQRILIKTKNFVPMDEMSFIARMDYRPRTQRSSSGLNSDELAQFQIGWLTEAGHWDNYKNPYYSAPSAELFYPNTERPDGAGGLTLRFGGQTATMDWGEGEDSYSQLLLVHSNDAAQRTTVCDLDFWDSKSLDGDYTYTDEHLYKLQRVGQEVALYIDGRFACSVTMVENMPTLNPVTYAAIEGRMGVENSVNDLYIKFLDPIPMLPSSRSEVQPPELVYSHTYKKQVNYFPSEQVGDAYRDFTKLGYLDDLGEQAVVCGEVVETRYAPTLSGGPTFLYFDELYPNNSFTAVIWESHRGFFGESEYQSSDALPALMSIKPETHYLNKKICITGWITKWLNPPGNLTKSPATFLQIANVSGTQSSNPVMGLTYDTQIVRCESLCLPWVGKW